MDQATFSVTTLDLPASGSLSIEQPLQVPDRDRSAAIEQMIREVEEGRGFLLGGARGSGKTSLLREIALHFNWAERSIVALGPLSLREVERSGLNSLGTQLRDWIYEFLFPIPSGLSKKSKPKQVDSLEAWVPFLKQLVGGLKADTLLLLLDDLDTVSLENRERVLQDIQDSPWGKITSRIVVGCALTVHPESSEQSFAGDPRIAAILQRETLIDLRRALDESIHGMNIGANSAAFMLKRTTVEELLTAFMISLGAIGEGGKKAKKGKDWAEGGGKKGWGKGKGASSVSGIHAKSILMDKYPEKLFDAPPPNSQGVIGVPGPFPIAVGGSSGGDVDFRRAESAGKTEIVEDVDATVYAPAQAPPGDSFLVLVYAHLPKQAAAVAKAAKAAAPGVTKRVGRTLDQPIKRGTKLTFNLSIADLTVDEPSQSITWRGKYEAVQFSVSIPKDAKPKTIVGTVIVSQNSVPIGHLKFTFAITGDAAAATAQPTQAGNLIRYRQAFISYASPDRAEVLKRVQILSLSKVKYFQDLLTLEPGDRWEKLIYQYIDQSDVFLLFWSAAASRSPWVEKEIVYAMKRKAGNDEAAPEIVPVIIEGPPPAAPPKQLSFLHFNDKFIYFITGEQGKA